MSQVVISLTVIPPRMATIGRTLESLVRQTAKIDRIVLWIPETYRRSEFAAFDVPPVPAPVEIRRCPVDYGPATKILPAITAFAGQDVRIIYCDDDRIYEPEWAELLLKESDRHPDDCIAEMGVMASLIDEQFRRTTPRYRLLRWLTLNIYHRVQRKRTRSLRVGPGLVDICQGFGGVLVKPGFFPPTVFDIPDILWTVDDVWLAGQLALNGVKIRKVSRRPRSRAIEGTRNSSLHRYTYKAHDRVQANALCVEYFRDRYKIWT